jgi:hypothetical protein
MATPTSQPRECQQERRPYPRTLYPGWKRESVRSQGFSSSNVRRGVSRPLNGHTEQVMDEICTVVPSHPGDQSCFGDSGWGR